MAFFERLFGTRKATLLAEPAVPDGRRIYAIGDIHGRIDLLDELLDMLRADVADHPPADVLVVYLGDLIDRGRGSAEVVRRCMAPLGWAESVTLKGNHEVMMLAALAGDRRAMSLWVENGGDTALESWGVSLHDIRLLSSEALIPIAQAAIPAAELAWLAERPIAHREGDYLFVHAGVRPGVPLDEQRDEDRMWIRFEFLDSEADHGAMIVHGHTPANEAEVRPNRIGIDTGAYMSDRLTALVLEGTERRFIQT